MKKPMGTKKLRSYISTMAITLIYIGIRMLIVAVQEENRERAQKAS